MILLGFNNDRAGRMAPLRTRGGLRRSAGAASCLGSVPRRPPPCAVAVRRAAAAGTAGSPRARFAPAFCCVRQFSRRAACAVTRRQARGALRAPLKDVEKVLTGQRLHSGWTYVLDLAVGTAVGSVTLGKLNPWIKSSPIQRHSHTTCTDATVQ